MCYIPPLIAATVTSITWGVRRRGPAVWWLNLLLYGGALFGIVDHLWWGELFLISEKPLMDLLLGVVITAAIFAGWGIVLGVAKTWPNIGYRMGLISPPERK